MALPKEPRQKMINIMYLVLTALLALNVSSEILNAFKVVDKSLTGSNDNLNKANSTLYSSLLAKTNEAASAVNAKIWQPKADQAKKLSDAMNTYIEDIKKQLKAEAGLKLNESGQEVFKEDDLEAATRLFGNGEGGKNLGPQLEQKLKDYRVAMLAIDPEIAKEFTTSLSVDGAPATGQDGKVKDFTDAYFHMTPTVAGLTLLSKFQNNVKNSENQVATFCHSKVGEVKVKFDKTGVLVGQSANYVMPGQEIEITAGIGAYSSAGAPQISIGGASVPVVDGQGKYKFQASGAGKQTKTVTIRYKDQNGIDKTDSKEIEYTIGTPGGAAVMLDKMNVFYIGVDNPVTIGSPSGWDKTSVSMPSGGSITGNGSARIVRVSSIGPASISVVADGKTSQFQFRCKKIPDPVFKVGSGRPRVPAVEFKNQNFCRAELENFDFDLKYSVVSAVVYFNGAGFSGVQQGTINGGDLTAVKGLMGKCMPGSSVTFDQVKVSGPDGQRTIEGRTVQLY
jgi:gliding motility-associated protein GldM